MLTRTPNTQSIAWVRDQFGLGNINLNPPYQRRSVWNTSFQQYFIDSILRNYPVPSILVNEEVLNDGKILYHVIDGKQRLTAILDFLEDRFSLGKQSDPLIQRNYYSQLEQPIKNQFLSYRLPFEVFSLTDANTGLIEEVYDRFNRNVARLNDQELRKAKFKGVFAQNMEDLANQLADDPFWISLKLFTKTAMRRMLDVEYVAELYILTMDGIKEPDVLDDYYAKFDDDLPGTDEAGKLFEQIRKEMERLGKEFGKLEYDFKQTRYTNLNDFYSLWAALRETCLAREKLNYPKTCEGLADFSEDVDSAAPSYEGRRKPSVDATYYSDAVRQGANKKNNRELRTTILRKQFVLRK